MLKEDLRQDVEARVAFLKKALAQAGAKGFVYGNSGGKDCTLVGILCKLACENTFGVCMPCSSSQNYGRDLRDGMLVAKAFGIETVTVDLSQTKDALMVLLQLPQPGSAGMFTGSGVGNVKDIAQAGSVPGIVHQRDPLGTAPYIPAHLFIPQIVLRTGGSVRSLGVDHQLLMERVFVKAGSSGEKPCPFLPAPRELCCHLVRHLCILFSFGWHGVLSSFQFLGKKGGVADCHPIPAVMVFTGQNPGTAPAGQSPHRSSHRAS